MDYSQLQEVLSSFEYAPVPQDVYNYTRDPLLHLSGLKLLGRMPHKKSCDVKQSALGIGFETLDRDTFEPAKTFRWLADSGIKYARCQTGWMKCEKTVGVYDFAWLDEVVDGLAAIGIETWFSVSFGHPVHTPAAAYRQAWDEANGKMVPGWPRGWVGETPYYHGEAGMAAWKNYVQALASHFKGRVRTWEIWNEPEYFWTHDGDRLEKTMPVSQRAHDYTDFVRLTAGFIREIIPDANISADVAQTATAYLRALKENGLPEVIDTFNYHFYGSVPESGMQARFAHLQWAMTRQDGTRLPIWQGESGRATGKSRLFSFPTQLGQARYITRRYLTDFALGAQVTSFFTITDFLCYYEDGSDQYYGVINAREDKPKLGYYAIQSMGYIFDGLERAPENPAFFIPPSPSEMGSWLPYNVCAYGFKRKGVPIFAAWQPEHVDLSSQPIYGCLQCLGDGVDESSMPHPVIIDPIRRNVWDASAIHSHSKMHDGRDQFQMPIVDYPYFVTDASLFDELL